MPTYTEEEPREIRFEGVVGDLSGGVGIVRGVKFGSGGREIGKRSETAGEEE